MSGCSGTVISETTEESNIALAASITPIWPNRIFCMFLVGISSYSRVLLSFSNANASSIITCVFFRLFT